MWAALTLALPLLPVPLAYASAVSAALSLLSSRAGLPRRMLWRTRYLFLALALLLPWSTPGRYAVMMLGASSPTVEGLRLAAMQFARAFTIVAALGWAMTGLDSRRRMAGFLFFLLPLARLGLPVERLAVRLSLTLAALEDEGHGAAVSDWKQAWRRAVAGTYPTATLHLDLGRWSARDWFCVAIAVMGVACAVGFNAGV